MITKRPVDGGARAKVTFTLPAGDRRIAVVGDFNDWDRRATPLKKRGDTRAASVTLERGRRYAFRYVDEDGRWFNDEQVDDLESNGLGEANCVIDLS